MDPRLQQLVEKVRALIEGSPYTATDIGRLLDVDRSTVSRWMSGERTPTLQNLIDLAQLLKVDMAELWTGPTTTPATAEQKAIVDEMAHMDPVQQQALLALARTMRPKP